MRFLFVALFLSLVQTAQPRRRQPPDNTSQGSNHRNKKAAENKGPVNPTSPTKNVTQQSLSKETTPENPAPLNPEQPIRVRELARVSVTRDWIDDTGWFFSLILVVVGIGGVFAAFRTLRAVERQAEAMDHTLRGDHRACVDICV